MAQRVEDSELFIQAAIEARRASRIYWMEGGPADRANPVHPDAKLMWPIGEAAEGNAALVERRRRREAR